jgi:hypothetical protein
MKHCARLAFFYLHRTGLGLRSGFIRPVHPARAVPTSVNANARAKTSHFEETAMKRIALVLFSSLILHPSAFGQGSLTPLGPPGPTMKTLQQIEPRTSITNLPVTITQPGSYYLTTNLSVNSGNGITVNVGGVTLDLMGFELVGPAGPTGTRGINAGAFGDIVVRHGTVLNWDNAVLLGSRSAAEDLRVLGANSIAIQVGDNARVVGCVVNQTSSGGCCGWAIATGNKCLVRDCLVTDNTADGIRVGSYCVVEDNLVAGNVGAATLFAGIHATGNGNRIAGNHVFANTGDGILVDSTAEKNFVVRNTAGGNNGFQLRVPGIPGQPPAGANVVGPIVNDATNANANAWANIQQF